MKCVFKDLFLCRTAAEILSRSRCDSCCMATFSHSKCYKHTPCKILAPPTDKTLFTLETCEKSDKASVLTDALF